MLSRVADSVFWMSRYIERAENLARFLDVTMTLMLDLPSESIEPWEQLLVITDTLEDFTRLYGAPDQEKVVRFLTFDELNPASILTSLSKARENARCVRETISSEMWEQVNTIYLDVKAAVTDRQVERMPHAFLSRVKFTSHQFIGVTDSTMAHGEAWHFNRLGRLLERAEKTSRLLDVKYVTQPDATPADSFMDDLQWSSLLKAASAHEMYRKKFGRIEPRRVAEFLVLDREFPRAAHYCLLRCEESVHAISGTKAGTYANIAEQRIGRLCSRLDYLSIEEIIDSGIHGFLDGLRNDLYECGDSVTDTFFHL